MSDFVIFVQITKKSIFFQQWKKKGEQVFGKYLDMKSD